MGWGGCCVDAVVSVVLSARYVARIMHLRHAVHAPALPVSYITWAVMLIWGVNM